MTQRITVSLPDELVQAAQTAVHAGQYASVSAYVAEALVDFGEQNTLLGIIEEMRSDCISPTNEDRDWARKTLGLSSTPKTDVA